MTFQWIGGLPNDTMTEHYGATGDYELHLKLEKLEVQCNWTATTEVGEGGGGKGVEPLDEVRFWVGEDGSQNFRWMLKTHFCFNLVRDGWENDILDLFNPPGEGAAQINNGSP